MQLNQIGASRVSCIIPAYNEATRIGKVLGAVVDHSLLSEIVVVDDCSRDGTSDEVREFPTVRLIVNDRNIGKSASIAMGVRASAGEYLLLLDADLVGLTPGDITALLEPVLGGASDVAISLRNNAHLPYRLMGVDHLSGERVLRRALIDDHLDSIARLPGFSIESYLNNLIIGSGARVRIVRWPTVGHTSKIRKYGLWTGVLREVRMLKSTFSPMGAGYQIIAIGRAHRRCVHSDKV
jgi:glycosyltransferase involved in cell wall biosynthesis